MKPLMIVLAVIVQMSCGTSRNAITELNGNWELIVFPAGTKTLSEIFTMKRPDMQLDNGRLSGNTGCNRMNGSYSASGSSFQVGTNLAVTKMGCPNYDENIFLEAFNKVNRYQIKNNELILLQDSTMIMTFAKK